MSACLHRENSRRSKLVEKVRTRAKRGIEGEERRFLFFPPLPLLPFVVVVVVAVFAIKRTFVHSLDRKCLLCRLT